MAAGRILLAKSFIQPSYTLRRFHPLRRSSRLTVDGARFRAAAIAAVLKPNSN
jgi:hypothetical protein